MTDESSVRGTGADVLSVALNTSLPVGLVASSGAGVFEQLVLELAQRLDAAFVSVGEMIGRDADRVTTLSLCADGALRPNITYDLPHSPCEQVLTAGMCAYPDCVDELFPRDAWLRDNGIKAYLGSPMHDAQGLAIGVCTVMWRRPAKELDAARVLLQACVERFAQELTRLRRERELERRNRDLQLMQDLAERLHRSLNRARLGHIALSTVIRHGLADGALWYAMDATGSELTLAAWRGVADVCISMVADDGTLAHQGLKGDWTLPLTDDAVADNHGVLQRRIERLGFAQAAVIPLGFMGRRLGALELLYGEKRALDTSDLDTLVAVGRTLSLALVNADQFSEIEYQALHDPLTGLANRARFHRDAKRFLKAGAEQRVLVLLDIRRFGEINKTLGHHIGDQLLREMAARMRAMLSDDALLSRLSGDEFAVLMPMSEVSTGESWLTVLVRRFTEAVNARPFDLGGMEVDVRCSLGIALAPDHAGDSHALLRCADVALQRAKQTPGEPVLVYRRDFDDQNPLRLALMTDLTTAIREDQLFLHFQPKVRLDDGELSGLEALVRWQHPELGLVPPGRFIPMVEVSDLIRPLTYWVLENALEQMRGWRRVGLDVPVAVNLSPSLLTDESLPEYLGGLLCRHDMPARLLELEITEGALLTDPERALAIAHRLHALGLRLSIDDFGTGYSSLGYLKRLPLAALKIDRSFVMEMLESEHDRIIVSSTIGLAHSLGLRVVAEGIETQRAFHALREMGCDEGQGFCIARPEPAAAVQRRLLSRSRLKDDPCRPGPERQD